MEVQAVAKQFAKIELSDAEEARFQKIRQLGVECSDEESLRNVIKSGKEIVVLDGFEPSGRMTIAHGLMRAIQAHQLIHEANCKFVFVLGDWFALMNNKCNGDLKKIQNAAKFMIEVWKSIAQVDLSKVEFILSSEFINKNASGYWIQALDVARRCKVKDVTATAGIMGLVPPSKEQEQQSDDDSVGKMFLASQIFYPCMQVADLFFHGAHIGHFGVDQRAIVSILDTYVNASGTAGQKPSILFHELLSGMAGGKKMSSADPTNAIFMDESENEVATKIKKAFCAEKNIDNNPVLELAKHIIFPIQKQLSVERSDQNGGNKTFTNYKDLETEFLAGLHPGDLKPAVAKALNSIMQPVRDHFKKSQQLKQLIDNVRKIK